MAEISLILQVMLKGMKIDSMYLFLIFMHIFISISIFSFIFYEHILFSFMLNRRKYSN